MTHPTGWPTAQSICDIPEVHEALDAFSHDSTEDNAVGLICAVLNHSPASVRAAALEVGERAAFDAWADEALEAHYDEHDSLRTYDKDAAWLAWQARALSAAPAGGLGEVSANENIGRVARKIVASLADSPVSALSNLVQAIQDADSIAAAQGEGK